ncbi:hypothetical protein [Amaricoccus sp.]|uniref:hypothetical protein n=1 Tax=Amaricoccus sp. TaxID=1872485 RepID=UPI001B744594|nr:hypothetical protein [Amaricoccus sp.]MBP7241322.1 hypothetical protein [Amaricoccus sp.]
MTVLVVLGVLVVVAGLAGLGHCIRTGYAIRREKPDPEVARARLRRLVAVNLASVAAAALGLMMVVMGLTLG